MAGGERRGLDQGHTGVITITRLDVFPDSFNAPPRSKMKLWKGATLAFMLCGAALSAVLLKNMAALGQTRPSGKYPNPFFTLMFQSFTESELQHVVGALLDRKRRRSRLDQSRRTKRARRPKPCSVRELKLTVSELGLGYESNETMLLRYCSGKCTGHRSNYDITMEHMMRTGFKKKGRKDKVSNGPCCRPTAFEEDFSFLDDNYKYRTIQNLSAKNCGCV
ncbi:hypothetical protein WMY93_000969 [Mugilogobius chulae]|uniref:TGF-beta family profile domain-containing protein n=1 Tax=Mugilogobius chulae TaxID=88201 RepID=A0AAW0Q0I0_9GOBI